MTTTTTGRDRMAPMNVLAAGETDEAPTKRYGDYCPSCGLTNHHWPGCSRLGLDDRSPLPTS